MCSGHVVDQFHRAQGVVGSLLVALQARQDGRQHLVGLSVVRINLEGLLAGPHRFIVSTHAEISLGQL